MEERFQRVSRDRLELTLTINDPKMQKPWEALDKFPFKLLPPTTDVRDDVLGLGVQEHTTRP